MWLSSTGAYFAVDIVIIFTVNSKDASSTDIVDMVIYMWLYYSAHRVYICITCSVVDLTMMSIHLLHRGHVTCVCSSAGTASELPRGGVSVDQPSRHGVAAQH